MSLFSHSPMYYYCYYANSQNSRSSSSYSCSCNIPRNWFENAYLEINYMTHNTVHAFVVYMIFLFELRKPQNPKKLQEPFANMVLALGDYSSSIKVVNLYAR